MGEWRGQYLDCPWDFRSKAPASQSFAEDKDSSEAPFPCYYAFLEREVPSTTKGAKVGKGKSPLYFKAASFFGALL